MHSPAPWPPALSLVDHLPSLEIQFLHFLQATPFGVVVVAPDGIITFANPRAHACFGYAADELRGQPLEILVPLPLRQRHVQSRQRYLKHPEQRLMASRELTGRRKDGTEVPVAVSLTPLPFGGVLHVVCTVWDLTELKRAASERGRLEQELLAVQEREQTILDNTAAVVYVKDTEGRYQFVNRRHAELFSLDRNSVLGKREHEVFPQEIADKLLQNDRRVLETGETVTLEEVVPQADGDHTYVSVKFPLFDSGGRITAVAGISTDITDQLRAREAEQQLHLARMFQQRLYPSRPPALPGLDVAGSAVPVSQMCGDSFDYVLRDDGRLAVCVGDVSGHGLGPALQMVEVQATLRLLLRGASSLARAVEELNRLLCADLPESSFVTLFLAEVDVKNRRLQYVGAGHQALLVRAGGEVIQLGSTGLVLGIDAEARFDESSPLLLGTGDLLLLFTDGLTEAMNLAGEAFGTRRVVAAVQQQRHQSSRVVLDGLFAAVYEFAQGRTLQDDMTALAVKVVG